MCTLHYDKQLVSYVAHANSSTTVSYAVHVHCKAQQADTLCTCTLDHGRQRHCVHVCVLCITKDICAVQDSALYITTDSYAVQDSALYITTDSYAVHVCIKL